MTPPTMTPTFKHQKFKSCSPVRKDVAPSLEKGGKRLAKLETKTIMKSSPTTTAKFED